MAIHHFFFFFLSFILCLCRNHILQFQKNAKFRPQKKKRKNWSDGVRVAFVFLAPEEATSFLCWRKPKKLFLFLVEKPRNGRVPGTEKLGFSAFVCLARECLGRESVRGGRWRSGASNRVRTSNSSCVADAKFKGGIQVCILFCLSLLWIFCWM